MVKPSDPRRETADRQGALGAAAPRFDAHLVNHALTDSRARPFKLEIRAANVETYCFASIYFNDRIANSTLSPRLR